MLITDRRHQAKFRNDAQHMRSNIGTARVVAEIFREFFFVALWSGEFRINRDPRHSPDRILNIIPREKGC